MDMVIKTISIVVGIIVLAAIAVFEIKGFISKDKDAKINAVKVWLRYAVTVTEKSLGEGTGQLKLVMAYSMATAQFPFLTKLISFEQFSHMVDDALVWMKEQLDTNVNVKRVITGIAVMDDNNA